VVDAPRLLRRYRAFRDAFASVLPNLVVAQSYKTAPLRSLLSVLHEEGAHAEVVSEEELALARALGVPGDRVVYNGPGKSRQAITAALAAEALINLDSLTEVDHVIDVVRSTPVTEPKIGLRVNVAMPEEPTKRSRFGLSWEDGELGLAAERLRDAAIPVRGLHGHLTHRRRRVDAYRGLVRELLASVDRLSLENLAWIDVGGGFGALPPEMAQTDLSFPSFGEYAAAIAEELSSAPFPLDETTIVVEPGIATVGDSTSFFAPVTASKRIGGRDLAVVDCSVHVVKPTRHSFSLPTSVYDSEMKVKTGSTRRYDVVGYTCLEDDFIARDQELPELSVGDVLEISNVGAYTWVFKPSFIRARARYYLWDGERMTEAAAAQSIEELFP
jgi:diaminopimelate decarboxylase